MRSYGDLCGIARALDVVGERWALLVVRELLLGPKRFADLHRGLSGVSQNVLSQRLRGLEEQGLVRRSALGPPARVRVYELTERGRELESVLLALGRWGSAVPPRPGTAMVLSVDALAVALKTMFDADRAGALEAAVTFVLGDDQLHANVTGGRFQVVRGEGPRPDATLTCDVRTVQDLAFGGRSVADVVASGVAVVDGDVHALEALLATIAGEHQAPA